MPKWPLLAVVMVVACSGEGDELPPLLGDCANCGTAPISGGSNSGVPEASVNDVQTSDVATSGFDVLDIVDTGVPNDL